MFFLFPSSVRRTAKTSSVNDREFNLYPSRKPFGPVLHAVAHPGLLGVLDLTLSEIEKKIPFLCLFISSRNKSFSPLLFLFE